KRGRVEILLPAAASGRCLGYPRNSIRTSVPACVGEVRTRRYGVRSAGCERVNTDELPTIHQILRRAIQVPAKGQIVSIAEHKPMGLVEIGQRFVPAIVVLAPHANRVVESERSLRLLVDRLTERIRAQKAQVV